MYTSFLFALALMASLCTDALAAGGYGHDNKYAVRNYNARIGHAGGSHRKRAAAAAKKLARGRARRRTPVIAEEPGVVHIPLQPVSARAAHSFKKHRHHAVRRHKMVMAVKSTNSTSSSTSTSTKSNSSGASKKEVQAALDDSITAPSGTAAKDSLGLSIEGADVGYFASLKIGTPGKTFKILMDSGSADFWVPSEDCSDAECGKHTQLGSKSSSTFKSSTQKFDITYGTGEVAGTLAEDTIDIAGLNLTGHTFGVTTAESQQFSDSTVPFDGLMGLAQSKLSEQGTLTPIEAMKKAGVVKQAVMGYALGRVADDTNIGQVTFGGVDSSKFTGSLTTVNNVSPDGFWEADVAAITVDGKSVLTSKTAVMDTGTTLIVAPPKDAVAVHKAIPGAKSFTGSDGSSSFVIPCTTNATVAFKIGNKSFLVAPEDLAFLPVDQNDLTGDCQSAITAGEIDGDDTWLLGDSFLKSNYLSTDVDANTIGLAPSKSG